MKKTSNNGITLIALVITVIVMLIIAGVSINYTYEWIEKADESKLHSEALLVQQAVRKQFLKYETAKNPSILKGQSGASVNSLASSLASSLGITLNGENYYLLNSESLNEIGITGASDEYVVDYETGEVINKTQIEKGNDNKAAVYIEGTNIN